jgi:uncharacterized protein (TIGR03790 family)
MGAGCARRICPQGLLRAARTLSAVIALIPALLATLSGSVHAATTLPVEGAPGLGFQVPWHQIGPGQLLILVNSEDPQSVQVADEYMARYAVPSANRLDLSFSLCKVLASDVYEPLYDEITDFLRNRPDLEAVAITWTEPWKVSPPETSVGMSITSAVTFGFRPEYYNSGDDSCAMTEVSPLYGADLSSPYTDFGLRPAVMIAGETAENAIDVIDRGVAAKSSFPLATGYLMRTTDLFRAIRYPQMEDAVEFWDHPFGLALDYRDNSEGLPGDDYLRDADDVLFYFTGAIEVDYLDTLKFLPGAVADHLTSSGGALTNTSQMSILRWLEAGATASYGTVTEPCSSTDKFPNVDMFMQRYFAGATLIDAYWQSVRMPGEGIFVGDPLAQPWAATARVNATGQVELTTTSLLAFHIYKLTGVNDGISTVLLNGVYVDAPQLRVLTVPAGFETYKLVDTGATWVDHGAPSLTGDSITSLRMPDGAWRFQVRASDPQNDDVYYSFQLASGELLEQSEAFSAELVLDGDVNRDGYVNFSDVGIMKGAMLSQAGDALYVPEADLNNNGIINFSDLGLLKGNFGGTHSVVEIVSRSGTPTELTIMAFDRWGSESRINAQIANGSFLIVP